jgi:hypothetical protein
VDAGTRMSEDFACLGATLRRSARVGDVDYVLSLSTRHKGLVHAANPMSGESDLVDLQSVVTLRTTLARRRGG